MQSISEQHISGVPLCLKGDINILGPEVKFSLQKDVSPGMAFFLEKTDMCTYYMNTTPNPKLGHS